MKKLLASDLDGTLLFKGELDVLNEESVKRLKKENHFFGVATGRPYNGIKFLEDKYNLEIDFYVLLNGALVLDKNKKVLKHDIVPYDVLCKICTEYSDCVLMGVDCGFETIILSGKGTYHWENIRSGNLEDIKGKKHSLISIDLSNIKLEEVDDICLSINEEFGEHIVAYRNAYFIDIVPIGCSKGDGINLVINELNVDRDNVFVIGDSYNDISMFKETKNSFTFNYVEEKMKSHANFLVDSVSECIYKYILGD